MHKCRDPLAEAALWELGDEGRQHPAWRIGGVPRWVPGQAIACLQEVPASCGGAANWPILHAWTGRKIDPPRTSISQTLLHWHSKHIRNRPFITWHTLIAVNIFQQANCIKPSQFLFCNHTIFPHYLEQAINPQVEGGILSPVMTLWPKDVFISIQIGFQQILLLSVLRNTPISLQKLFQTELYQNMIFHLFQTTRFKMRFLDRSKARPLRVVWTFWCPGCTSLVWNEWQWIKHKKTSIVHKGTVLKASWKMLESQTLSSPVSLVWLVPPRDWLWFDLRRKTSLAGVSENGVSVTT